MGDHGLQATAFLASMALGSVYLNVSISIAVMFIDNLSLWYS